MRLTTNDDQTNQGTKSPTESRNDEIIIIEINDNMNDE